MSREAIRAAMAADGAADVTKVEGVPESWGEVYVRAVTLAESERVARAAKEKFGADFEQGSAFTVAMVLCDADGERVFDPLNAADLAFLESRRSRDVTRILQTVAGPEKN